MTSKAGVFLIQNDSLTAMKPEDFPDEENFQELLARHPDLLVGDQIDPDTPRRWILVKREQSISTGEANGPIWAIDHVFLDQDGIPTLVEIKRKSDRRLRREVVGQMLDYAANCATYWTSETLQIAFEQTCSATGRPADEVLTEHLNNERTGQQFWTEVHKNLQSRNLRLIFVADHIPTELRRVVEFLNSQMNPTEVLAVELRHFVKDSVKAIVPTVIGHSEVGATKRAGMVRKWDEASLFEKLRSTASDEEFALAQRIFNWMHKGRKRAIAFGTGKDNGSVYPIFKPAGVTINPFFLSSDGKVSIQFGALANKPVFGEVGARRELMQQFNNIPGVSFTDSDLTKYPPIRLGTIVSDLKGPEILLDILAWMEEKIEAKNI